MQLQHSRCKLNGTLHVAGLGFTVTCSVHWSNPHSSNSICKVRKSVVMQRSVRKRQLV
jgi:hypothetical protein